MSEIPKKIKLILSKIKTSKFQEIQYSPYVDGVTQSLLGSWMNCRMHSRNTLKGYRLKRPNDAFLYGSCTHYLHEMLIDKIIYNIKKNESNSEIYFRNLTNIKLWVAEHLRNFAKTYPDYRLFEPQKAEDLCSDAAVIFCYYIKSQIKILEKLKWIKAEHKFNVPFNANGPGNYPTEKPIILRGMIDGVFRNPKTNKLWLLETKTKSRMNEDTLMDTLMADFQSFVYMIAIHELYGEYPAGVLYNVLRKPCLRRKKDESIDSFGKRIEEDVNVRTGFYFVQFNISVNSTDIQNFEIEFRRILSEFVRWWENGDQFEWKNREYCENKYGCCPFLSLCTHGDTSGYRISELFPELA